MNDATTARLDVLQACVLAIARTLRPSDASAARYYLAAILEGTGQPPAAEPGDGPAEGASVGADEAAAAAVAEEADEAAAATLAAVLQALDAASGHLPGLLKPG